MTATVCVAAETSLAHSLSKVTPVHSLNVLYLFGLVPVAWVWGLRLGLLAAVASTLAFDFFLAPPVWSVRPTSGEFLVALATFLSVALVAAVLSRSLRPRSASRQAVPPKDGRPQAGVTPDMLHRIVDELAALRHLATLVADAVPPGEVLDAVAREMAEVLGARHTVLARYEPNGVVTFVGGWNYEDIVPAGSSWQLEHGTVSELVRRTHAPGRVEAYDGTGELSATLRANGVVSSIGCPITVDGRLWGVAIVSSCTPERLPDDAEERMRDFVEIAIAVIANAQSHTDLMASRARVAAASDETRRHVERDLHDGTQQRLIGILLKMRSIEAAIPFGQDGIKSDLACAVHAMEETIVDLREIVSGLHPAILVTGGIEKALTTLARRAPLPVELSVSVSRRLAEPVERAVYYLVSEALTNVAKHAHASLVHIVLIADDAGVRLSIDDDGVGGADLSRGSGLIGLTDRVETLGGALRVTSHAGRGTSLLAEIPAGDGRS